MQTGSMHTTVITTPYGSRPKGETPGDGLWTDTMAAGTFNASATRRRSDRIWISIFCSLLSLQTAAAATTVPGGWYFVTGTPTDADQTYPSVLYSVDGGTKKLHIERQIVSNTDGVHSIHWSRDTIFVHYPNLPPSNVSVVHMSDPARNDTVAFDPNGRIVVVSALAMAESRAHVVSELMWLLAPEDRDGGMMVSIAGAPPTELPRIKKGAWGEYSLLRFDGIPGGPVFAPDLVGTFEGDSVGIKVANKYIVVDQLGSKIAQEVQGEVPYYVGVNEDYLVFGLQNHADDVQSGALAKKTSKVFYVRDRRNHKWSTLTLEGTCSRTRILGPWLGTIVQYWNPAHNPNPGGDHERNVSTDRLPNVRELYSMSAARSCFIPGVLTLQNLSTGQQIRINTGQEE